MIKTRVIRTFASLAAITVGFIVVGLLLGFDADTWLLGAVVVFTIWVGGEFIAGFVQRSKDRRAIT